MNDIIVNTQSSIKISGSKIIYFDPYKINDKFNDADIVFITHDHYDHLDIDSLNNVINDNTKIVIPSSIVNSLLDLNIDNELILVEPNNNVDVDDIKVKTLRSYNIGKRYHPKENNYVGYIVELDNKKYYVMGDTDINEDINNIECDILFIPIGGTYTCDYKEAAEYVNRIKPDIVIPIHYGSIVGDISLGEEFKKLVNSDINVILKLGGE